MGSGEKVENFIFILKCFKDVSFVVEDNLILFKSVCSCNITPSLMNSESPLFGNQNCDSYPCPPEICWSACSLSGIIREMEADSQEEIWAFYPLSIWCLHFCTVMI